MKAYVTYRLGDNDFGSQMRQAAEWLVREFGRSLVRELDDATFLSAMANHMAGATMALSVVQQRATTDRDLQWYYDYFASAKIDRTIEGSRHDGGGGCVSIDCSMGSVWTH